MRKEQESVRVYLQYSPINVGLLRNVEHLEQTVMIVVGKGFGKEIGSVVSRWDLLDYNGTRFHQLTNIMVANVDMLDLSMVFGVLRQRNRSLVVSLNHTRCGIIDSHLSQPCLHPYHLLGTSGHGHVLGLNRRKCNCRLTFTTPGDWCPSHKEHISGSRTSCVPTSPIVRIDEGSRGEVGITAVGQSIVKCILDVPYNVHECLPMINTRRSLEARE